MKCHICHVTQVLRSLVVAHSPLNDGTVGTATENIFTILRPACTGDHHVMTLLLQRFKTLATQVINLCLTLVCGNAETRVIGTDGQSIHSRMDTEALQWMLLAQLSHIPYLTTTVLCRSNDHSVVGVEYGTRVHVNRVLLGMEELVRELIGSRVPNLAQAVVTCRNDPGIVVRRL